MASGKAHVTATVLLTPLTAAVAWQLTDGDLATTLLASAGCFSGIVISPDLDLGGRTISEVIVIKWMGALGWLWVLLWAPYARVYKHRGISHVPLLGTATRVLYLALCYVIIHCVLQQFHAIDLLSWPQAYWQHLAIGVAGLSVSDIGHWVLDDFDWR